jgi:hypothetical protein
MCNDTFPLPPRTFVECKVTSLLVLPKCSTVRSSVNTTNTASKSYRELTDQLKDYEFSFRTLLIGIYSTQYAPDQYLYYLPLEGSSYTYASGTELQVRAKLKSC